MDRFLWRLWPNDSGLSLIWGSAVWFPGSGPRCRWVFGQADVTTTIAPECCALTVQMVRYSRWAGGTMHHRTVERQALTLSCLNGLWEHARVCLSTQLCLNHVVCLNEAFLSEKINQRHSTFSNEWIIIMSALLSLNNLDILSKQFI